MFKNSSKPKNCRNFIRHRFLARDLQAFWYKVKIKKDRRLSHNLKQDQCLILIKVYPCKVSQLIQFILLNYLQRHVHLISLLVLGARRKITSFIRIYKFTKRMKKINLTLKHSLYLILNAILLRRNNNVSFSINLKIF